MAFWTEAELKHLREIYQRKPRPRYANIAQEVGRSENAVRNKIHQLRLEGRHDWLDEERIAFFDIESSHLKANIGHTISWALKPMGEKEEFQALTRREAINWDKLDRRLIRNLIKRLKDFDLIVTYYGTGFDNKFIRTRAMILGMGDQFPAMGELKHFDLYYAVKGNLALHSNRLAVATQTLGIHGKTPLPPEIWGPARLGYPAAMKLVEEHNREDVKILEELYHEMLPHVRVTRRSI